MPKPKPGDLCKFVTVNGETAVQHEDTCPQAGTTTDVMGNPVTERTTT